MHATGRLTIVVILVGALLVACASAAPAAALAPAQGSTLASCEALAASFVYPRTAVIAATAVPAGELAVAGTAIGAHCRVVGAMNDRVGPVDGKRFVGTLHSLRPRPNALIRVYKLG